MVFSPKSLKKYESLEPEGYSSGFEADLPEAWELDLPTEPNTP